MSNIITRKEIEVLGKKTKKLLHIIEEWQGDEPCTVWQSIFYDNLKELLDNFLELQKEQPK